MLEHDNTVIIVDTEAQLAIITRLLKVQGLIAEALKKQELQSALSTEILRKVYNELDGSRTATEIARVVGTSRVRIAKILPEWEKLGIVISEGLGPHKRYFNLRSVAANLKPAQEYEQR